MNHRPFSIGRAAILWTAVLVPLSWGIWKSVQKSLPLFQEQSKPAITTPVEKKGP
jgi:hypothetical protein